MTHKKLLLVMAHPDDAEFSAGGLMTLWYRAGHQIKILCLTNGNAGHHTLGRNELADQRREEARQAADLVGADLEIWPVDDGRLTPSIELREKLIGVIRDFAPDLIVTHRTADYHPDHRATGQLVQDSAYLLQVPAIAPEHAALSQMPSILLTYDRFQDPRPFRFDWVIDTGGVQDNVIKLLACHASQVFDWLPSLLPETTGPYDTVWLKQFYQPKPAKVAKTYRTLNQTGNAIEFAEAFEVSDYGSRFTPDHYSFV